MRRLFVLVGLAGLVCLVPSAPAQNAKTEQLKKGLQALNDFVGSWTGDGKTEGFSAKKESWQESLEWGWKFKGDDIWMIWKFKDSKSFKGGDLRYVPEKKNFELTLVDAKDQKLVFTGAMDKDTLVLERSDPKTKDNQRLRVNAGGDGVFLNLASANQKGGKGLFSPQFKVAYKMDGASLGAREKKQECVVSGGLGTSAVTFKGQTYYICCSGCRDAFNENPEFYVKQFEAKKKK